MKIFNRWKRSFQPVDPLCLLDKLTLWAVPVAARVVCLLRVSADIAPGSMSAQNGGAACDNGVESFYLLCTQMII
jgi:hypothetical protein